MNRARWRSVFALCLTLGLSGCTLLGRLPYDPQETPPEPDGGRIRASLGWLATRPGETPTGAPDGSEAIEIVYIDGHAMVQRVRHFRVGTEVWGDSILLDRNSLRPFETYRWTPSGTYITRYNHRIVDRTFVPLHGKRQHSTETLDVEPFSALGFDLLVASLPLGEGYRGQVPVAVDTASRGWSWLHFEVQKEVELQERADQPDHDTWIVDCDIGPELMRLWISMDGRTVRKMERITSENVVLSVVRRMLLALPSRAKHAG